MNGFKDSLLWQLQSRAMMLLTGGTEFRRASEQQLELLKQEVHELATSLISDEELNAHFSSLPPPYFLIHPAKEVLDDLELTHRFMHRLIREGDRALSPVTAWLDEPDRGYNLVKICTWDRAGLFGKIAGSLSAAGLNILSAQIFTRTQLASRSTPFSSTTRAREISPRANSMTSLPGCLSEF